MTTIRRKTGTTALLLLLNTDKGTSLVYWRGEMKNRMEVGALCQ